jgi:hypothetical protein
MNSRTYTTDSVDKDELHDYINSSKIGVNRINRKTRKYKHGLLVYDKAVQEGKITPLTDEQKNSKGKISGIDKKHFGLNYPKAKVKGRRVDTIDLTQEQKDQIISLIKGFHDELVACDAIGGTVQQFNRAIESDPEFKQVVENYKILRPRHLRQIAIDRAFGRMDDRDPQMAALALKLEEESEAKSHSRKMSNLNYKLRKKESEAKVALFTGARQINENRDGGFHVFNTKELNELEVYEKKQINGVLSEDELKNYNALIMMQNERLALELAKKNMKVIGDANAIDGVFPDTTVDDDDDYED